MTLALDDTGTATDSISYTVDGALISSSLTDPTSIPIRVTYIPTIFQIGSP